MGLIELQNLYPTGLILANSDQDLHEVLVSRNIFEHVEIISTRKSIGKSLARLKVLIDQSFSYC